MPLYHTMGIHSLTSMAAIDGCFVCHPEWSAAQALALIARERLSALYLIPTLFWDLVHAPGLSAADVSTVRKLAYAGAPMLAPLTEACVRAFRPDVFVNHYGSTEIYTFTVRPDVGATPGSAGGVRRAPRRTRRGRGARREGRDHREPRLRRGLRRLLEPAGRRRERVARRLVLHGGHGLARRGGRAVRGRSRRRHDHQRRRERPPGRDRGGAGAAPGGA